MSTRNTGLGVMTTLRQIVQNLDAQRDQLTAAIERDYPSNIPCPGPVHRMSVAAWRAAGEPECRICEDGRVPNPEHERAHRDLIDVFKEIAHAREALVDAHNLLRDVVAPIDLARPRS